MPKVFIINNSGHDYSDARRYGELIYLTKGIVAPFKTNLHYRELSEKMKHATPEDYILITSLASLNCIAGWIIGTLGFPLNMLIYKENKYIVKKLYPTLIGDKGMRKLFNLNVGGKL